MKNTHADKGTLGPEAALKTFYSEMANLVSISENNLVCQKIVSVMFSLQSR